MITSTNPDQRETREFDFEVKFLVNPVVGAHIRNWARGRFAPDPNGSGDFGDEYRTTSLYFETVAFDVLHRRGSFGRSKYRVRRYGTADVAFLERKLRTSRSLVKRRTAVPTSSLDVLGDLRPHPGWPGYWFEQRLSARRLSPVCQVSYHRMARIATTSQGPARITIDDRLRAMRTNEVTLAQGEDMPVLDAHMILELKFRLEMPAVFKELLEQFVLTPDSVSKYRAAAAALSLEHRSDRLTDSPAPGDRGRKEVLFG